MKVINAGYKILTPADIHDPEAVKAIYKRIELAGRTCYKSEDKITEDSAKKFVAAMVKNGHEAMLEHANMTVKFIVDRGVSHELVRHRMASYAQESTRYCNYSQDKFGHELTFIRPTYFYSGLRGIWCRAMENAEQAYFQLLGHGVKPEEARCVLPTSIKTEVVMTANMREWRHFLKLRAAGITGKPHPQMLEVTVPLLNELESVMPELFGDIVAYEEPHGSDTDGDDSIYNFGIDSSDISNIDLDDKNIAASSIDSFLHRVDAAANRHRNK